MSEEDATLSRVRRLQAGLVRPLWWPFVIFTGGMLVGATAGAALSFLPLTPELSLALALVAGVVVATLWLLTMRRADVRGAMLLYLEHDALERRLWKEETGSGMPRTRGGMLRWAEMHPSLLQRAFLLLGLGRIAEADRLIGQYTPASRDDELALELARQSSVVFGGREANLDRARELLPSVEPAERRRMRSECVALLEAMGAVVEGGNPATVLGSRWRDLAPAPWSRRDAVVVLTRLCALVSMPVIVDGVSLSIASL